MIIGGIDLVLDEVYPVLLEDLPCCFDFVHPEDDDRFLADPVDRRIEVEDIDLRLGQRIEDGVHPAGVKRDFGGENRGDLAVEPEALQDRCRPFRVVDDHPHGAGFRGACCKKGLCRDVFPVEDIHQPGEGARHIAQEDGDLRDCHVRSTPPRI
jgi:hypothetical protein